MGIVIRQGIRTTLVSYAGVALGYINIVWLFPHFFTPEQYGAARILLAFSLLFAQAAQLGVPGITLNFFPRFREDPGKRKGFVLLLSLIALGGFILAAGALLLGKEQVLGLYRDKSALFTEYFHLSFPLAFFLVFYGLFEAYSWSLLRTVAPAIIKEVILRVFTTALIFLFVLGWIDFDLFMLLFVLQYGLTALLLAGHTSRGGRMGFSSALPERPLLVQMVTYGLYALLSGAAGILVTNIDTLMLGYLSGLSGAAVYTVAFFIATVIELPQRAVSQVAVSLTASAWKEGDTSKIRELYSKSSLNQLIIGMLLFAGIWANAGGLLSLLPPVYAEGRYVILFVALGKLVSMACGISGEIIVTSRYYRFNLAAMLVLVALAVTANWLLIPVYGVTGAAVASLLSASVFSLVKFVFIRLRFGMQPFSLATVKVLLLGGAALAAAMYIPPLGNVRADILVRSLAVAVLFGLPLLALRVSPEVNEVAGRMYKYLRSF